MSRFCAVCGGGWLEHRDNWDWFGKVTYFLSTGRTGSHNIVAGFDNFKEWRKNDNWQSGSQYNISATRTIIDPGAPGPRYTGLGNVGGFTRDAEVGAPPGDYIMVWGKRHHPGRTRRGRHAGPHSGPADPPPRDRIPQGLGDDPASTPAGRSGDRLRLHRTRLPAHRQSR